MARPGPIATNNLNEQDWEFVKLMSTTSLSATAAMRIAAPHVKNPAVIACTTLKKPAIKIAIANERAKYEAATDITRRKVIDGIIEAIDMARVQADPTAMIGGWKEIGKLCGHYEPTKAQLVVTFQGRATLEKLERMSDAELLRLSSQEIEGEFTEVGDGTDT